MWAAVNRSLTVADKLRKGFPGNCKKKDMRFINIAGCISYDSSQAGTALKKPRPLRAWPQWLAEIEKRTAYSRRKPLKARKNRCKGIRLVRKRLAVERKKRVFVRLRRMNPLQIRETSETPTRQDSLQNASIAPIMRKRRVWIEP